jgi:hypothetical protein
VGEGLADDDGAGDGLADDDGAGDGLADDDGAGDGLADDDGAGDGLAEARGVAVALVHGGVDPDDPHETDVSMPSDPNTAAKKLPRWKRNRGSLKICVVAT